MPELTDRRESFEATIDQDRPHRGTTIAGVAHREHDFPEDPDRGPVDLLLDQAPFGLDRQRDPLDASIALDLDGRRDLLEVSGSPGP